jgi:drug/metabolite transporter (DMT)-like permease
MYQFSMLPFCAAFKGSGSCTILSMGIFYGLTAAVFWGLGDFFARSVGQRIGGYRALCYQQFVGIVGLTLYLLATGTLVHIFAHHNWQIWLWASLAVILNLCGSLALYRAFEVGVLSLVSPIASSYAIVTVILAFLSGEVLTAIQNLAIVFVLLGVIVCSIPAKRTTGSLKQMLRWHDGSLQGIIMALIAALGYGATFWLLGFLVTPGLGSITPIWLIRIMTPCILFVFAPLMKQSLKFPPRSLWWALIAVGFFDTLAYIGYTTGMLQGEISLVTMFSSLYSVVTIILAWIFLRERLYRNQWLGIVVILFGIFLVNV